MNDLEELALVAPGELYGNSAFAPSCCDEEISSLGMAPIDKVAWVGMAEGSGFKCTNKLKVVRFKDTMASTDKDAWTIAVEAKHDKF